MEATVAAGPAACRERWVGRDGEATLHLVLAQRFGLMPHQRVQVINNTSLVTDLAGIVLQQRDLRDGMLLDVDMRAADCRAARLSDVLIQCAKADTADFGHAQFDDVFFWKSSVRGASFADALLHKVTFEESCLAGTSFARAALHGVRFHSLDLSGCDFDGARFDDCNFFDVRIDERHRARLEGMGRAACRLSRVSWMASSVRSEQPVV